MNILEQNIFDKNMPFTQKLYQEKINLINQKEEIFRTISRETLHPEWKIFRRITREYITIGGVFTLNLTMYEYRDKSNKLIRFTYYHDDFFKEFNHSKYQLDIVKLSTMLYLENKNPPAFLMHIWPSKQMIQHFIKKYKIDKEIEQLNAFRINEIRQELQQEKHNNLFVEMDDLFIKIQDKKSNEKLRIREAIFHTKNDNKLSNVLCLFFTKKCNEKITENNDLNYVISNIKKQLNILNSSNKNLILNGDGASWMRQVSKEIKANFSLDLFHIKHKINNTFGFSKFAPKEIKKYYKNWYSKYYKYRWKDLFDFAIQKGNNFNVFLEIMEQFKIESKKQKLPKNLKLLANNFFRYIIKNAEGIFNNNINFSSHTEHFVCHSFKSNVSKRYSIFSLKSVKIKVIYNNLLKGQATIFF